MPANAALPLSDFDDQRFITVYQVDENGIAPATFGPHASLRQVARALCDNEIADCTVYSIVEAWPFDGTSRYVTEDVANLIPEIIEEAHNEGWTVRQACARELMKRFKVKERDRRAMAEAI